MTKIEKINQKSIFTIVFVLSTVLVLTITRVFISNSKKLTLNCSYLDPVIVDVVALLGGAFLVIEGIWSIIKQPASHNKQICRVIRILFGVAIFTIHVLQIKYG